MGDTVNDRRGARDHALMSGESAVVGGTSTRCPLCGSIASRPVRKIRRDRIWAGLTKRYGMAPNSSMIDRLTPSEEITLRACDGCGLLFFEPLVPGDHEFYEQLAASGYHEPTRWEFNEVAGRIKPGERVIDLGCGAGAFLSLLSNAGRRVGVDIAIDRDLAPKDLELFEGSAAEYSRSTSDLFDVITAFHVLEHVGDLAGICDPARRLLRPGGRFFVSVPDEERPIKPRFELLDLPPHHVSRWRIPQLERLGEAFGFSIEQINQVPRVFSRWPDNFPRPLSWAIAVVYHGLRGGHVDLPKLLSDENGDDILVEFRKPGQ